MSPEPGTISKVDDERRLVFGWAYISKDLSGETVIDKQGDFIDDDWELESAAYDFVLNSGLGDEMHLQVPVSKVVESMVFTPDKIEKMGIPAGTVPTAWWVGFRVDDNAVWDEVKKGTYRAFSVGGAGVRQKVDD